MAPKIAPIHKAFCMVTPRVLARLNLKKSALTGVTIVVIEAIMNTLNPLKTDCCFIPILIDIKKNKINIIDIARTAITKINIVINRLNNAMIKEIKLFILENVTKQMFVYLYAI